MKKLILLLSIAFAFAACNNPSGTDTNGHDHEHDHDHEHEEGDTSHMHEMSSQEEEGDGIHFGDEIDEAGAISVEDLSMKMKDTEEMNTKVKGEVTEVCQKKGCWMKLKHADGNDIMITFKDYGFFVPRDLDGETVVMKGKATYDTLDVETLRHYAEDAGKSGEEIAEIIEPEVKLAFVASGVKILQ